jgi:hypothetical protein
MNLSPTPYPVVGGSPFYTFLNGFEAGEVITVSVSSPTTGHMFQLESPVGTVVAGPTSVPGSLSYTIPTTNIVGITARILTLGSSGSAIFRCTPVGGGSGSEVKFWDPGDDRINREPGQPAALYCRNQGDLHVYAINVDNSKGYLGLVVTKAEIDAVINGSPVSNTLVKQSPDSRFRLYYLPATKELSFITPEVRSGKPYTFVWKGLCH